MESGDGLVLEPVSPNGRHFSSSVISLSILAVLESEIPINESEVMLSIASTFLPISPRFSSIMVENNGKKQWEKVEVNVEDHVKIPTFPPNLSPKSYDKYFDDYISKLAVERFSLDHHKPLWEIHIFKYPTSNAPGSLLFKIHHAIGDGFSLMSGLLANLKKAGNPSLSLTLPSRKRSSHPEGTTASDQGHVAKVFSSAFNTVRYFLGSVSKSTVDEDDLTPIRSGNGSEFQPVTFSTMTLSLDQIKSIKTKLGVTVNDVLAGMIFLGTRLYMQEINENSSKARVTAALMLNTRTGDYTSIQEMIKSGSKSAWGNRFTYLQVPIPNLLFPDRRDDHESSNKIALDFVRKAHKTIRSKRDSFAIYLTNKLVEILDQFGGHEAGARYIYSTMKNSSMLISNMIGPVEQMAWPNHPIKGLYFLVLGFPEGLDITIVSYMGKVRIAFKMEQGLVDPQKFKLSMEKAFQMILKATDENKAY